MRIRMGPAVFVLGALTGCWALGAAARQPAGGARSIAARDLRAHVRFLASDALSGRDTGQPGVERAEEYIAGRFERFGLAPLPGGDDYFLDFTLFRQGYDPVETSLSIRIGERTLRARAGVDFRPFGFSDEGRADKEIVFAGYGITAPEHGYDDYEGLHVAGKIVLVLRHEPGEDDPDSPFDGTSNSQHALFATKAENARKHAAAGMLLVTDPLHHEPSDDLRLGGALRLDRPEKPPEAQDRTQDEKPLLAAQISREVAESLVASTGRTLAEIQRAVDAGRRPAELALGQVTARISVRRSEGFDEVAARDVAGWLEGSDPRLKHEWIVVGGHHDHIGGFAGTGDTVFNGADDNASGTAGVLELAQAFASLADRPRRSLLFVTFTGEERGLLGSRALMSKELIPLDAVVFMLNLDMIGRNPDRPLQVFGDGYVRDVRGVVESANRGRLPLEFRGTDYNGNSDHDPFYERDIPFLFLFTGTHEDYHQLGDHVDKLEYGRMESIVRLAYEVLDRLAKADGSPRFVHVIHWLGAEIEVVENNEGRARARVTGLEDGSRGAEAGLRVGDTLASFDGAVLEDPHDVGRSFRAIEPGTRVALGVWRDEAEHRVSVQRAKTGYLGVFPEPADEDQRRAHGLAEDEGIVLKRVVDDGPASRAGLEEGDIVIGIAGRPVGSSTLRARLAQIGAGETVQLQLVRDGERTELSVTLGERPARR